MATPSFGLKNSATVHRLFHLGPFFLRKSPKKPNQPEKALALFVSLGHGIFWGGELIGHGLWDDLAKSEKKLQLLFRSWLWQFWAFCTCFVVRTYFLYIKHVEGINWGVHPYNKGGNGLLGRTRPDSAQKSAVVSWFQPEMDLKRATNWCNWAYLSYSLASGGPRALGLSTWVVKWVHRKRKWPFLDRKSADFCRKWTKNTRNLP